MKRYGYGNLAVIAILVISALMMAGCEQKTVNEILADPGSFANKEVTVAGTVARSYSVLGKGAYEIDDGTGKLWIVSDKGVPREGAKVAVKGTIRDGYNLGSIVRLPEPISSGLVMIEASHKAR